MRIPSGVTDQYIYFVAVDSTDLKTRETGLTAGGFTVYRSRNGGTSTAMTTPTVNETDATNMPGVYELLLDEDMTIGDGNDSEEMVFHITATGMAPVTRTIELYRTKITAGRTLDIDADGDIPWNADWDAEVQSEVNDGLVAYNAVATTNLPLNFEDMSISASGIVKAEAGYQDGAVWIDTINGTTGTTSYTHGTADKPSLSWASAKTIADNLDIRRFILVGESSITLTASTENYEFIGQSHGASLALGTQNVSGCRFVNLTITGNDTGSFDFPAVYDSCELGVNSLGKHWLRNCRINGTITLRETNTYYVWENCFSYKIDSAEAVIDFSTTTSNDVSIRGFRGWIEIRNMSDLNDHVIIDGIGNVTFASTVSNGTAYISGNMTLTNSATGGTLNDSARVDNPSINAEVLDCLTTDTYTEPGQGAPGVNVSLKDKIGYLYKAWRNKTDTDDVAMQIYADNGSTVDHTASVSDNGTTATRGEVEYSP